MSDDGMSPTWADIHGSKGRFDEASFLAQLCHCGHSRADHRRPDGREPTVKCRVCADGHYFMKAEHYERHQREARLQADPTHVHGTTHTAYGCPGFIPFQVCDECGGSVLFPVEGTR